MSEFEVGDTVDHMTNVTGFHSKGGVFFRRIGNGDVRIQVWSRTAPFTLLATQVIDAHTWASVVSSVSYQGEDYASMREALEFHERRVK